MWAALGRGEHACNVYGWMRLPRPWGARPKTVPACPGHGVRGHACSADCSAAAGATASFTGPPPTAPLP